MNHIKFDILFYPKVFGLSICFEKMSLVSTFKYRFDLHILWLHVSLLMFNKYTPKY